MAGKKKSGKQDRTTQTLALITAILNLIRVTVDLINKLLE